MKTPHDARIAAVCRAIEALSILSQQDAIDIACAMVPKFPRGADEAKYLLDAVEQIEDDIAAEAEDDSEYALAEEPEGHENAQIRPKSRHPFPRSVRAKECAAGCAGGNQVLFRLCVVPETGPGTWPLRHTRSNGERLYQRPALLLREKAMTANSPLAAQGEDADMRTRADHLAWCKQRALEYCDRGERVSAFTSLASDLQKHPETANHPGSAIGLLLMIGDELSIDEMRRFIEGFN